MFRNYFKFPHETNHTCGRCYEGARFQISPSCGVLSNSFQNKSRTKISLISYLHGLQSVVIYKFNSLFYHLSIHIIIPSQSLDAKGYLEILLNKINTIYS